MPLELNGKPWAITDEDLLRKYSKEHVFVVAKQFIKINNDPDATRVIETAPIHLPTSYVMYEMVNGVRKNMGVLRYYEAHSNYVDNGRVIENYTPQYIAIGHNGILKSQNIDLNFFIDNAPFNETVKNDSTHHNYVADYPTMCRTFDRKTKAAVSMSQQKIASNLMNSLLDEKTYPYERLKSLAHSVVSQAGTRLMATKLFDWDTMEEVALRTEMVRLAMTYTLSMDEIMKMSTTDITDEIMKWKQLKIIEFTADNEWVFHEAERVRRPIMTVPNNTDPVSALTYFLKNNDPYYKIYKPIQERYNTMLRRLQKKKEAEKDIV